MPNLFTDCDDTLALYCDFDCGHDAHFGSRFGPWVPNEPLIKGIHKFRRDNPDALIVVWSGGGAGYAETFAHRLLPGVYDTCMDKWGDNFNLVRDDDIVVDDQKLPFKGHRFPDEWPDDGTD